MPSFSKRIVVKNFSMTMGSLEKSGAGDFAAVAVLGGGAFFVAGADWWAKDVAVSANAVMTARRDDDLRLNFPIPQEIAMTFLVYGRGWSGVKAGGRGGFGELGAERRFMAWGEEVYGKDAGKQPALRDWNLYVSMSFRMNVLADANSWKPRNHRALESCLHLNR